MLVVFVLEHEFEMNILYKQMNSVASEHATNEGVHCIW